MFSVMFSLVWTIIGHDIFPPLFRLVEDVVSASSLGLKI